MGEINLLKGEYVTSDYALTLNGISHQDIRYPIIVTKNPKLDQLALANQLFLYDKDYDYDNYNCVRVKTILKGGCYLNNNHNKKIGGSLGHISRILFVTCTIIFPILFVAILSEKFSVFLKNNVVIIIFFVLLTIMIGFAARLQHFLNKCITDNLDLIQKKLGKSVTYKLKQSEKPNIKDPSIRSKYVKRLKRRHILKFKHKSWEFGEYTYEISNLNASYDTRNMAQDILYTTTIFNGTYITCQNAVNQKIGLYVKTFNEGDQPKTLTIDEHTYKEIELGNGKTNALVSNYYINTSNMADTIKQVREISHLLNNFKINNGGLECSLFVSNGQLSLAVKNYNYFQLETTHNNMLNNKEEIDPRTDINKDIDILLKCLDLINHSVKILR